MISIDFELEPHKEKEFYDNLKNGNVHNLAYILFKAIFELGAEEALIGNGNELISFINEYAYCKNSGQNVRIDDNGGVITCD